MANIAIIYGSVRSNRQGIKVVKFLENKLKARKHKVTVIDPKNHKLPLLNKMHKEYSKGKAPKDMEQIHKILNKSDGFLIVSAEYNHSIPPALKNILDHYQKEYLYKPSAIATYSAGPFAGMRVAMHLRALLPELGMSSIPTIFGVSKVQDSFDDKGTDLNGMYEKNVGKFLDEFEWYVKALKTQRLA